MTLKDEFLKASRIDGFLNNEEVIAATNASIADKYAIDFTEWCVKNELFHAIQYGRIETKSLLEMYKKEKEL